LRPADFKSAASADFAIRACELNRLKKRTLTRSG
jgi:hypothetical protein